MEIFIIAICAFIIFVSAILLSLHRISNDEPEEIMIPASTVKQMMSSAKKLHDAEMANIRHDMDMKRLKENKEIRADAVKRHKNTIKGKVTEHLIPYMDEFNYNPSDCRFLGSPIDMIVFDGLSDGEVKEVVLLEIKTGPSANLSTRERKIRDAIKEKRVSWRLIRKNK